MPSLRLAAALAAALGVLCAALGAPPAAAAAGHTAGRFAVTPQGAATYAVPLALPPGVGRATPALSLEYHGARGAGLAGLGVAIGGLSQVTRCARTLAQDGVAAAPALAADDRYCLDGQRLRLTGGSHGADGATYATEAESYARVTARGAAGAGPASFTVERADGLVAEYGSTPDARAEAAPGLATVRHWALAELRDRSGNAVRYRYSEDAATGEHRLAAIEYPYTAAGAGPWYRVEFATEPRPAGDVLAGYALGQPWRETQRLAEVRLLHWSGGWQPVRRWRLGYTVTASGRSRLAQLTECDAANDCLAPTRLEYYDGYAGWSGESVGSVSPAPLDGQQVLWLRTGGDGVDDLVYQSQERDQFHLQRNAFGTATSVGAGTSVVRRGDLRAADLDGDGRDDLAYAVLAAGQTRVFVLRGSSHGFAPAVQVATLAGSRDFLFADLDGDGRDELVHGQAGATSVAVRANLDGTLAAADATAWTLPVGQVLAVAPFAAHAPATRFRSSLRRADFDGDAREDLLVATCPAAQPACSGLAAQVRALFATGSGPALAERAAFATAATPLVADWNGDGLSDLAYAAASGLVSLRYGTGLGLSADVPTAAGTAGFAAALAADWNGDGRHDLLLPAGTRWNVHAAQAVGLGAAQATTLPYASGQARRVFAQGWSSSGTPALGHVAAGRLRRNEAVAGHAPDALLAVSDGAGAGARDLLYQPSGYAGIGIAGAAALGLPQQLVVSASLTDGQGGDGTILTLFNYESPRLDRRGRGFQGFARVLRQGLDADFAPVTSVEGEYLQDFPLTGRLARERRLSPSGALLGELELSYGVLALGTGADERRYGYVAQRSERRWETSFWGGLVYGGAPFAVEQAVVNALDPQSGLVTDLTVTTSSPATLAGAAQQRTQRRTHGSVVNDLARWCLGRPAATQLASSHTLAGGASLLRRSAVAWDTAACRPTEITLEPGDPQWQLRSTLGYDALGQLASETVSGAGFEPRSTSVARDARGQFVAAVTNAAGETLRFSWHAALGVPLGATDASGLTTTLGYDGHGRLTSVLRPDGTRTTIVRNDCAGGCAEPGARYRVALADSDADGRPVGSVEHYLDRHGRTFAQRWLAADGRQARAARTFDLRGRTLREELPAFVGEPAPYVLHEYDEQDRRTARTRHAADGTVASRWAFEHRGLETVTTGPRGATRSLLATPWGVPLSTSDAAFGVTRYEHDAFGQPLRVVDAAGNAVAQLTWNVRGLKVAHADLDGGSWEYRYDAAGQLTGVRAPGTPAGAWTTTWSHDALGRVTARSDAEGTSTWTWGRSAAARDVGRLVAVNGPGYAEALGYDALGRLARRSISTDATYRYDYGYDAGSRLATLAYPETAPGRRLTLAYEYALGELVAVRDAANAATVPWQRLAADAAGRVTAERLGNGVQVDSTVDPATGRLEARRATRAGTTLSDVDYGWDAAGNLVERRDQLRGLTETFEYDLLDRLTTVRRNGSVTLTLGYDAIGNITHKSDVGSYTYDPARRHAVTAAGSNRYGYDARGQMTSRNGATIAWSSAGLPLTIAAAGASSTFEYGPDGQRHRHLATSGGASEDTRAIGALFEPVLRDGRREWRHYVAAPTGVAAVYVEHATGADTLYLTHDHLGSTQLVLQAAGGAVRVEQGFDAFGQRRAPTLAGPPSAGELAAIAASTRDGYTGHEQLDAVGLVHMNGRVYDPRLGRFLSPDPLVQAPLDGQALNRYAYVFNNPLSYVDPSGYQTTTPPGADGPRDLYWGNSGAPTLLPLFGLDYGAGASMRCIAQCIANDAAWEQRVVAEARAAAAVRVGRPDPGATAGPFGDFVWGLVSRAWVDSVELAGLDGLADLLRATVAATPDSPAGQLGADLAPAAAILGGGPLLGKLARFGQRPGMAERQAAMLADDVGYNVSPASWFRKYETLGAGRTFVTDREAISSVIGPFAVDRYYRVGWFRGFGQVTAKQAAALEQALGLRVDSLQNGFRITRVDRIGARSPRAPTRGNEHFLGEGRGLPGGGPELEVNAVPTPR